MLSIMEIQIWNTEELKDQSIWTFWSDKMMNHKLVDVVKESEKLKILCSKEEEMKTQSNINVSMLKENLKSGVFVLLKNQKSRNGEVKLSTELLPQISLKMVLLMLFQWPLKLNLNVKPQKIGTGLIKIAGHVLAPQEVNNLHSLLMMLKLLKKSQWDLNSDMSPPTVLLLLIMVMKLNYWVISVIWSSNKTKFQLNWAPKKI